MSAPTEYIGFFSREGLDSRIKRFTYHSTTQISFEFTAKGNDYWVQLQSIDGIIFRGNYHNATEDERGLILCGISMGKNKLNIEGDWLESSEQWRWFAKLLQVVH